MRKLITKTRHELKCKYYADDSGHIWSEQVKRFLREYDDKNGYKKVELAGVDKTHRFSVHRLVLETFQPVPNMWELQVDHIDGDRTNNALSNLRWTTAAENLNNPNTKMNRRVYDQDGTHNASAKFTTKESLMMLISDVNSGQYTRKEVMEKYDICRETLRKILNRTTYTDELKDTIIDPKFKTAMRRNNSIGEENPRAKLTNEEVLMIIKIIQSKQYTLADIARMFEVSPVTIGNIKNKKTWKHLTKDIVFD